jgi:hypothetical protein
LRVAQHGFNLLGQFQRVSRLEEKSGGVHEIGKSRNPARNYWHTARHRLERGEAEPLPVRGLHIDIGELQQVLDIISAAQKVGPAANPKLYGEELDLGAARTVSYQYQVNTLEMR